MEYMEEILSKLKKQFGDIEINNINIFYKTNKKEAQVYINGVYWATYDVG